jgi:hypothetical protein
MKKVPNEKVKIEVQKFLRWYRTRQRKQSFGFRNRRLHDEKGLEEELATNEENESKDDLDKLKALLKLMLNRFVEFP